MTILLVLALASSVAAAGYKIHLMSRRHRMLVLQSSEYAQAVLAIYNLPNLTVQDCKAMAMDGMKRAQDARL